MLEVKWRNSPSGGVSGYHMHYTSILDKGLLPDTWKAMDNPQALITPQQAGCRSRMLDRITDR